MKRRLYTKICSECGKEYNPFHKNQTYCSNKCRAFNNAKSHYYIKMCKMCKTKFKTRKKRNQYFCSRKCYLKYRAKNGKIIKCVVCGRDFYITQTEIRRKRKFCSNKCMGLHYSKIKVGKNNNFYKDGKSKERAIERDQLRQTIEYKNFVKFFLIRDNNICIQCGTKRKRVKDGKEKNCNLTVHHIKSWKNYPKLRFDIDNGITLCKDCHFKIHKKRG